MAVGRKLLPGGESGRRAIQATGGSGAWEEEVPVAGGLPELRRCGGPEATARKGLF